MTVSSDGCYELQVCFASMGEDGRATSAGHIGIGYFGSDHHHMELGSLCYPRWQIAGRAQAGFKLAGATARSTLHSVSCACN